jgi:lactoylglutathione lyase
MSPLKRLGLGISWLWITAGFAADFTIGDVNHIGLTVTDLEASQRFFVDVLGFEPAGGDPEYPALFVANNDIMVTLWRATDPQSAIAFDRKQNVGLHHLAFNLESFAALDALYAVLRMEPDVVIEFSPELLSGGPARHMMIREPSGNRLEFIHIPPRDRAQ